MSYILDIIMLSRRHQRFHYIKKIDAWSTVLLFDWLAIILVELSIKFFRGKLYPDHFTALSVFFFFSGVSILIQFDNPWIAMSFFYISIVMDCVDGKLARALEIKTQHGAVCDALADCTIHGFGHMLIALWIAQKHGNTFTALLLIVFSIYMVLAHINDVMVHLNIKDRATHRINPIDSQEKKFFSSRGLYSNPIDIVDLNFFIIPFMVVAFPSNPYVFPTSIASFLFLKVTRSFWK